MAKTFDVAVMHDFFVDRLVHTDAIEGLALTVRMKAAEGGGGVHGISQEEVRGGNAVNLAHALARLGLRTLLITHSDRTHEHLLRGPFEGLPVELRVKPAPPGLTVALEERVNVMLGDGGGAKDFGPSWLSADDWRALQNSKVVCSVNWAVNARGTGLLVALRKKLGSKKPIFFDPADFRDRIPAFRELLGSIARKRLVDWLSMNQQEGLATARALGIGTGDLGDVCKGVAKKLGVLFDLHGAERSYSSDGSSLSSAAVEGIKPRRLTGAGDVWDAAAIYGRLRGMDDSRRLRFANRAAKIYLESQGLLPASLSQMGLTKV